MRERSPYSRFPVLFVVVGAFAIMFWRNDAVGQILAIAWIATTSVLAYRHYRTG
jgi:hypothetical protein